MNWHCLYDFIKTFFSVILTCSIFSSQVDDKTGERSECFVNAGPRAILKDPVRNASVSLDNINTHDLYPHRIMTTIAWCDLTACSPGLGTPYRQ
jgi:hypothetical protein